MNKNISFFIALAIFNFALAEEPCTLSHESNATENQNFITRTHNLTIKIQAKNTNDTAVFDQKAQQLFETIQTAHRTQNGSNLYNQILIFIKETQEAILAGLNLFATATTSNSIQVVEAIKDIIVAEAPAILSQATTEDNSTDKEITEPTATEDNSIAEDAQESTKTETNSTAEEITEPTVTEDNSIVEEAQESTTTEIDSTVESAATETQSKDVVTTQKNIEISISISLEKAEDENLFNILIVKMNDLAQALNEKSDSAENVTNMLNDIILAAHHLPNTNLTIKIN